MRVKVVEECLPRIPILERGVVVLIFLLHHIPNKLQNPIITTLHNVTANKKNPKLLT